MGANLGRRLLGLLLLAACTAPAGDSGGERWIPLFNGRDLQGWTAKISGHDLGQDPLHTFRVEDGLLRVAYDGYELFDGRFGHLFFREPFSNYRLRVEYRFTGEQAPGGPDWAWRNSGVMIHCQPPETLRRDQDFPVCLEVQLLGGDGRQPRPTANLCTPGTHVVIDGALDTRHCIDSRSPTFAGDGWVSVEVEVTGGGVSIRHLVNGEEVLRYEQPQLDPGDPDALPLWRDGSLAIDRGWIALQAESHPVEFRRVELQRLD